MSKGTMIILIVVLFVSIDMIEITNATKYIKYGPLKKNHSARCSQKDPQLCKLIPANPYQRGCNPIERCRGGKDIIEKVDDASNTKSNTEAMSPKGEPLLN